MSMQHCITVLSLFYKTEGRGAGKEGGREGKEEVWKDRGRKGLH